VISELCIGKYLGESGRGLILMYSPGIPLDGLRKTARTLSRLGGVVVSVLATGPKSRGFEFGQGDVF
jgi:hypothetical protein